MKKKKKKLFFTLNTNLISYFKNFFQIFSQNRRKFHFLFVAVVDSSQKYVQVFLFVCYWFEWKAKLVIDINWQFYYQPIIRGRNRRRERERDREKRKKREKEREQRQLKKTGIIGKKGKNRKKWRKWKKNAKFRKK